MEPRKNKNTESIALALKAVFRCRCIHCGHQWEADRRPFRCAHCKSRTWTGTSPLQIDTGAAAPASPSIAALLDTFTSAAQFLRTMMLAHGRLVHIDAIMVHQTGSATAKGTIAAYRNDAKGTGAHFLIGKDGTIYQVVSIQSMCWHVGPILSRCYARHACAPKEEKFYDSLHGHSSVMIMYHEEMAKPYPQRYPPNTDSIGIEIVSQALGNPAIYEHPTPAQNCSLQWLIAELLATLKLTRADIYRHPQVSRKNRTEAEYAVW